MADHNIYAVAGMHWHHMKSGGGGTDERGSITKGKYADFLLVDKDVLSCPVDQIHEAGIQATYFEGKTVYSS